VACSGSSSTAQKIDPNAPDELAFQAALAHYDAGAAAQVAARAALDPGVQAAQDATAVAEYGAAQAGFHRLQLDFPTSLRVDNSAYLEGRSRYEIGTITRLRSDFVEAWTLLEAAIAAHPASRQLNGMTYFAGRSMFQLAELDRAQPGASTTAIQGELDQARARFVRSVQVSAAAPWGDNAAYYVGRCDFEVGYLSVHPLELAATPGTDPARFQLAEAELAAVPAASSYRDNARYYRGRSFFEEPTTTPAERLANLASAIADFDVVIGLPGPSTFAVNARYWRGRSHYSRAFELGAVGAVDQAELELALADMKAVAPTTSVHAASALYFEAKVYLNLAAPGPYCATARAGEAAPASSCAAYRVLEASFPASTYVAQAQSYLLANGCDPALCPP
jgi:TolA-binding protein